MLESPKNTACPDVSSVFLSKRTREAAMYDPLDAARAGPAKKEPWMAKKLLVIDDQTGITKVVELIARQLGLNARSLNSSSQATEEFIAFMPDVVMLDMIMPEKDGIDVLNEILLTGLPVKVILTSGFSDSYLRLAESVAKFHDNEQVSILRKPFRRDELVTLLKDLTEA
jgi:DNA-binding NtrC family response regulator